MSSQGSPSDSGTPAGTPAPAPAASKRFILPSINTPAIVSGASYTYYSPVPPSLLPVPAPPTTDSSTTENAATTENATTENDTPVGTPCALGVDEAGRGPVLGPMVYGVFYLPIPLSDPLLRQKHHFDDSKALTPAVREALVRALCDPSSDLAESCGYAVSALSARDIGAGMLRPATAAAYNLNAQAMDATVELIRGVMASGVNVAEIYVDTVGPPVTYEQRLQRLFPTARVTVAKKADSLYPCVSAASVCAKVTRDKALEVLYRARVAAEGKKSRVDDDMQEDDDNDDDDDDVPMAWGSGYPSDGKCVSWLKNNMHPIFGWGPECRFSWGTAKDLLEGRLNPKVEWPVDDDDETAKLTSYFASTAVGGGGSKETEELGTWFGTATGLEAF